jgi:hypothetical protein
MKCHLQIPQGFLPGWVAHPCFDSVCLEISHYGTVSVPSFAGVAKWVSCTGGYTILTSMAVPFSNFGKSVSLSFS